MNDTPFHSTRMGARFYESTVPELVRQLTRLNDNLERLIGRGETEQSHDDEDGNEEEAEPADR